MLNELLNYLLYGGENNEITDEYVKVGLVSIDDLKKVNLQPVKNLEPNPSRNMPPYIDKVDLRNLNKAQLDAIMNVKLKPIPPKENKIYEPRHPCLKELLITKIRIE